jgi:hypothetical protein
MAIRSVQNGGSVEKYHFWSATIKARVLNNLLENPAM